MHRSPRPVDPRTQEILITQQMDLFSGRQRFTLHGVPVASSAGAEGQGMLREQTGKDICASWNDN